ncbi:SpoIIE family protein phosphatase [Actinokineospora auranticolor]|uniref:Sigma-B regulation protein RsbU (Phosphoserine phosphatase) n=1 Tax=Actinokineospora auranticolor TaxID=155976 RepID=A0A2S6GIV7_9PSEU|nr:SpoIIE family protein phosphatase [Actinokineospora auranticolor]PPK65086.1 sigma-B regulation protein RsbU (phosphoserine phosphatase) [Actinokineospora auranticolor]
MMGRTDDDRTGGGHDGAAVPGGSDATFAALLEDDAADLYDNAPCGYLSTLLDGHIAKVNKTLLTWLGYQRDDLVGRLRFTDLLTVGGKLYHETHFAPLLRLRGQADEIALELRTADGHRLPVLVTSTVKTAADGQPLLIRTSVFDARQRRAYERELLRARREADAEREQVERERARLQQLSETLQRTLLPPILPVVPGIDAAAHYHVATHEQVGGDFYDLFPLGPDRWGFFLGDVCGKGPDAAAITSLTRYTLRAAAVYDPDPAAVLSNLNNVLLQQDYARDARYCTVLFGLISPDGDGFTLTLAGGGHLPALLTRADGRVEAVSTAGGQLIGILPDARIAVTTTRLEPGDSLLLYTDGLTEARHPDGTFLGEEHLIALAADFRGHDARTIIDTLARVLHELGDRLTDDTALLVLTVPTTNGDTR